MLDVVDPQIPHVFIEFLRLEEHVTRVGAFPQVPGHPLIVVDGLPKHRRRVTDLAGRPERDVLVEIACLVEHPAPFV